MQGLNADWDHWVVEAAGLSQPTVRRKKSWKLGLVPFRIVNPTPSASAEVNGCDERMPCGGLDREFGVRLVNRGIRHLLDSGYRPERR